MKTNKWKLALLVWSAMFPFSTAISYGMSCLSFTTQWPLAARTFCLTAMLVPFMVFGALPFLNRRFQRWLQLPATDTRPTQQTTGLGHSADQTEMNSMITGNAYPQLTTNGVKA